MYTSIFSWGSLIQRAILDMLKLDKYLCYLPVMDIFKSVTGIVYFKMYKLCFYLTNIINIYLDTFLTHVHCHLYHVK